MIGLIEVRLFGSLSVRRADGSVVAPREWRTAKSRDLLRILAVRAGETVPTDQLVDELWPEGDRERTRASLRTAVAHVRRAVNDERIIVREYDGLSLQGAWVDNQAFLGLAEEARRCFAAGRPLDGLRVTDEATALYAGELCTDERYADWAAEPRRQAGLQYGQLVAEAAEAALELGWLRHAVEFAETAVAHDSFSERCFRVLMRAYQGLGEAGAALQAFERCRTALAEELGASPAPDTDALHRSLLLGEVAPPPTVPLVGRDHELEHAGGSLARGLATGDPVAVVVGGPAGVGSSRLARELARGTRLRTLELAGTTADRGTSLGLLSRLATRLGTTPPPAGREAEWVRATLGAVAPVVVVIHDLHLADEASRHALARGWAAIAAPVGLIVTVVQESVEVLPDVGLVGRVPVHLRALPERAVADLIGHLCRLAPTPALVDRVMRSSVGLPAAVIAATRDLLAHGQLRPEAHRIDLSPAGQPEVGAARGIDRTLASARSVLGPPGLDLMEVLAVAGGPLSFPLIAELLSQHARGEVYAAATQLEDLTVLMRSSEAFSYRQPALRLHAYQWMRPSRRDAWHIRLAQHPSLPEQQRAEHWLATGRPSRAVPLLLSAATSARAEGSLVTARLLLLQARECGAALPAEPARDRQIREELGDVCLLLGLHEEAAEIWEHHPPVAEASPRGAGPATTPVGADTAA